MQQLVRYVTAGHFFYFRGVVPPKKNPREIDAKLLRRYEVEQHPWTRSRRKQAGIAAVHYLRYKSEFVLLATRGRHRLFLDHEETLADIRRTSFRAFGYAVRHTLTQNVRVYDGRKVRSPRWHTLVRLDRDTFKDLRAHFVEIACRRTSQALERELRSVPFEPYRPVREQLLTVLRAVNRKRKARGLERVPYTAIRSRHRVVRPFGEQAAA